ncbi:MAG: TRAP transporter small permease [Pseudorhodobacter sp.]
MGFDTLRRALRLVTAISLAVLLPALTFVTVVDVVGRYLFSSPLPGGPELTEILLMSVVFLGLPAITLDDGHVTADLFTQHLKGRAADLQLLVARLLSAVALGFGAWQLWLHGARLTGYGQVTIYLQIPIGPLGQVAAVVCGLSSLLVLAMAILRAPRTR